MSPRWDRSRAYTLFPYSYLFMCMHFMLIVAVSFDTSSRLIAASADRTNRLSAIVQRLFAYHHLDLGQGQVAYLLGELSRDPPLEFRGV
jgi:hypothetical protein